MEKDIADWLTVGLENGWVTLPYCVTHDGSPYDNEEEVTDWDDGGDPCHVVVRLVNENRL